MYSSNISQAEWTSKFHLDIGRSIHTSWGHAVAEHTTNRKVSGSFPDGFFGILYWHKSSGRTMALRSTQPLTEMNTRNIF